MILRFCDTFMSFFSGSINVDFLPLYPFCPFVSWARFRSKAFCFLLCVRAWFCGRRVEDDDSMIKEWKIMLCVLLVYNYPDYAYHIETILVHFLGS